MLLPLATAHRPTPRTFVPPLMGRILILGESDRSPGTWSLTGSGPDESAVPHELCLSDDLRVLRRSLLLHGYRFVMGDLNTGSFGVEIWIHDQGDNQ